MNFFDYVSDSITEQYGDDLLPNYPLKNSPYRVTEEYIYLDEEESEREKEFNRKKLENRKKNFSEGVDIFKDFQYLDIYTLEDDDTGWNYFGNTSKMQYLNLMSSIQSIGLFSPLIIQKKSDGKYMIISGHSRVKALKDIYRNVKIERYRFAPCFIIGEVVEEYFIRSLIIDANLSYKTISRDAYMRAIFERAELLKRTKNYKNEINISQTVADEFGVSKGTINNYLRLKKLCNEAQTLVSKKELNLSSAKKLTKFNYDDQLYILEHTKLEDLNEAFKATALTKNIDLSKPVQQQIEMKLEILDKLMPSTTTVKIEIAKESLNKFFQCVIDFKKVELAKFSMDKDRKYIKKKFKVSLDESDMKIYKSNGTVDEDLMEKVCSVDYMEIMRA